jgi:hypothetical protein
VAGGHQRLRLDGKRSDRRDGDHKRRHRDHGQQRQCGQCEQHSVSGGSFTITGDYTCPSASTLVYLTATGGNPGMTSGTNNSALVLVAALGQCGSLSSSTVIAVNEVTTVASVYALAQFTSTSGNIGAPSSNSTGIASAFANVNNMVNTSTGAALVQHVRW